MSPAFCRDQSEAKFIDILIKFYAYLTDDTTYTLHLPVTYAVHLPVTYHFHIVQASRLKSSAAALHCEISGGAGSGSGLAGTLSNTAKERIEKEETGGATRMTTAIPSPLIGNENKRSGTPTRARSNTTSTLQPKAQPQHASSSIATHKTFGRPNKAPAPAPAAVVASISGRRRAEGQGEVIEPQHLLKPATAGLQRFDTPTRPSKQLHATPPSQARQGRGDGQRAAVTPRETAVSGEKAVEAERNGNRYGTPIRISKEAIPPTPFAATPAWPQCAGLGPISALEMESKHDEPRSCSSSSSKHQGSSA